MQGSACNYPCHGLPHSHGRRMLASGAGHCLPSTLWIRLKQTASLCFRTLDLGLLITLVLALRVAKGHKTMLRRNICIEDGLVNGAMGTIVGFEWPEGRRTEGQQPCGLHILFDDSRSGRMTRNSAEHLPTGRLVPLSVQSQQPSRAGMAGLGLSDTDSSIPLSWLGLSLVTKCKG